MDAFAKDLLVRLFERETLVTAFGLYMLYTGRITTVEEAASLMAVVGVLVGGRSIVKAAEAKGPNVS